MGSSKSRGARSTPDATATRLQRRFIVAEITKTWEGYRDPQVGVLPTEILLSELFEQVIEVNLTRGYGLHSFQLHQVMTAPETLTETIIAVFEKAPGVTSPVMDDLEHVKF